MSFRPDEIGEHLETLHRYAMAVTRDRERAADLVQDTVVRALERRQTFRGDAPLEHWLIRIAHHLSIDRARRGERELPVEAIEERWRDDAYTVDAATVVQRAAARDDLLDALVHLPFILRSAVVLHDLEGRRVVDVAAIHDITLPAAKQRLRRGRMALVSALAEGGDPRHDKGVPMRCWDARQHVSDYLDGDLDPTISSEIEAHLRRCPTCPPLYASLVGVRDGMERLGSPGDDRDPDTVIAPELEQRIRAALHDG